MQPLSLADSRQNVAAYLSAFEQALERVPAPLRHRSVDDLTEELSWLDSRSTTALLAAMGSPQQAAEKIRTEKMDRDRLRRRRIAVRTSATAIALLGLKLLVVDHRTQPRCGPSKNCGAIRPW